MAYGDDRKVETHSSWGVVSLHSTMSSGTRLFRSPVISRGFMTFRVARARLVSSDGHEPLVMADDQLIEFGMSAIQFAELLTTGNMNSGVPCTLTFIQGEDIESAPQEADDVEETAARAAGRGVAECVRLLDEAARNLKEELDREGAPRRKVLTNILGQLGTAQMRAGVDLKWWRSELADSARALRTKVAGDFAAFVDITLKHMGIDALREKLAPKLDVERSAKVIDVDRPED